jgi:hypothetical protein
MGRDIRVDLKVVSRVVMVVHKVVMVVLRVVMEGKHEIFSASMCMKFDHRWHFSRLVDMAVLQDHLQVTVVKGEFELLIMIRFDGLGVQRNLIFICWIL